MVEESRRNDNDDDKSTSNMSKRDRGICVLKRHYRGFSAELQAPSLSSQAFDITTVWNCTEWWKTR